VTADLRPGVVLVIRTSGWAAETIRIGAALAGKPNLANHVAVVHHTDAGGTTWCVEGRPGGVGWVDARAYLASQWTMTNAAQPFTAAQGTQIATTMQALLGTPYDWDAICADALTDLGLTMPGWDPDWHGTVAGHLVCSSAAQYAYAKAGLARPGGDRGCQPADWSAFILTRAWTAGNLAET
jgi:hypothetical protein